MKAPGSPRLLLLEDGRGSWLARKRPKVSTQDAIRLHPEIDAGLLGHRSQLILKASFHRLESGMKLVLHGKDQLFCA